MAISVLSLFVPRVTVVVGAEQEAEGRGGEGSEVG